MKSGIRTVVQLPDAGLAGGLRVQWMSWDSPLRAAGLKVGDLIVAVDAVRVDLQGRLSATLIGQPNESFANHSDTLRLAVERDFRTTEITGRLYDEPNYRDSQSSPLLSANGPRAIANDGFGEAWAPWVEKLSAKLSWILDGAWFRQNLDSRKEVADLQIWNDRLTFLEQHYPGPLPAALRSDFNEASTSLKGLLATDPDLAYRDSNTNLIAAVSAAAKLAWERFQAQMSPESILLPPIIPRQMVNDLGNYYAVTTELAQPYLVRLSDSPQATSLERALFRYRTHVSQSLAERFQFIGVVSEPPRMIGYQGRPLVANVLTPLALRAGEQGECFVDLRNPEAATFAGEDQLKVAPGKPLSQTSSPAEVMNDLIAAVKTGNEDRFKSLFAPWRASVLDDGRGFCDVSWRPDAGNLLRAWDSSRRLITSTVYDARVNTVGPVYTLIEPGHGLPHVEQVTIYLDHYGLFDGEYRSFAHYTLHRRWTLQRLNSGPWRIADVQGL